MCILAEAVDYRSPKIRVSTQHTQKSFSTIPYGIRLAWEHSRNRFARSSAISQLSFSSSLPLRQMPRTVSTIQMGAAEMSARMCSHVSVVNLLQRILSQVRGWISTRRAIGTSDKTDKAPSQRKHADCKKRKWTDDTDDTLQCLFHSSVFIDFQSHFSTWVELDLNFLPSLLWCSSSVSLSLMASSKLFHVLRTVPSSHISINSCRLYFLRKNRNTPHFSFDSQKHRYGASSVISWLYLIWLNGGLDFLKLESVIWRTDSSYSIVEASGKKPFFCL